MDTAGYVAILLISAATYLIVMIGNAGWNEHKRRKRIKAYNKRKAKEKHDKQTH